MLEFLCFLFLLSPLFHMFAGGYVRTIILVQIKRYDFEKFHSADLVTSSDIHFVLSSGMLQLLLNTDNSVSQCIKSNKTRVLFYCQSQN